ncbi:hypothetical protein SKDZ_11G2120 [Saccharomyces kudriavzevii ZP591]|nr:hypothetical protein SKDZ_11G2120 [Saccharomyces kudriavzevii ZP591]
MMRCLRALLVLLAGGGSFNLPAVRGKTVADPNLCPSYNSQLNSPFLTSCNQDLNKCVFHYFDEQYAFCRSCVIVNNETMEDSNNCRCLQCALSSLNNSCFQDYCTSGDEYKKLQIFIEQFQRVIGAVDNGVSLKSRNNKFSSKKLSYFVDQNHTVFRNPLPFEKTQLISALLTSLTNNQNRKTPLDIFKKVDMHSETQRLRKRRRTKKKSSKRPENEDEDEDGNDCDAPDGRQENSKQCYESLELNDKKYGETYDENNGGDADDGDDDDNRDISTKHSLLYTITEIHTTCLPKEKKLTARKPREFSKNYLVSEPQSTKTITTDVLYKTDTKTETKTTLITSTEAKRRWLPRTATITTVAVRTAVSTTTTTTAKAIPTGLSKTVVNPGRFKKVTGIKLGPLNASDEAVPPPNKRIERPVVGRNRISDFNIASTQTNLISTATSQTPSQAEFSSGQYISAASQLDKEIFIFTAITVSITTLMMLGFSYRSRVSFGEYSNDESEDDEDWSDEEVELDEEDFYSLPVSIPEKGISLDKMAQQLGVE